MKTKPNFSWQPLLVVTSLVLMTESSPIWAMADQTAEDETVIKDLLDLSLEELMQVRIVTIATGTQQTTRQAAAVTTVITAEDIKAMGTTELSEVLQSVPGVYIRRSDMFYQADYAIRGIGTAFNAEVLVMINDIPISHLVTGGSRRPVWDAPRLQDIARIEIIRGPGSAVYGADAYSGVINIITKNAKDINGTEVGARVGSFDSHETWLLHGGKYQGVDFSVSVQAYHTAGPDEVVTADEQSIYDRQLGTQASATPGPMNLRRDALDVRTEIGKDHWLLRAGYQGRYHVGRGTTNMMDPLGLAKDNRYNIDLTWHNPELTRHWDVTAQVSYQTLKEWPEKDFFAFLPGAARQQDDGSIVYYPRGGIFNIGFAERHSRAELSGLYSGWSNQRWRIGVGYHFADNYADLTQTNLGINPYTGKPIPPDSLPIDVSGTAAAINPTGTRSDWHVYLQDEWQIMTGLELTAGVRYDHYSDFGKTTNPRLALVQQLSEKLTGKLLYGKAFRAPSLAELTTANTNFSGTANLKPQTIETWELATEWQAQAKLRLAANVFYYEATNKIEFVGSTLQNIGIQRGRGVELETLWQVSPHLNLSGYYAYQKSVDSTQDTDMGYAPHQKIYVRGDWLLVRDWHLYPQVMWIGERNHTVGDSRPPLDSYTKVDLTLRYQSAKEKKWSFATGVRDLFDTDARDPSSPDQTMGQFDLPDDIPILGRQFFLELEYRF